VALSGWIVDTSVAVRLDDPVVAGQLAGADGPLHICEVGILEQLYSTRSARDYDRLEAILRTSFDVLSSPPDLLRDAQHLQRDLSRHRGLWHRRPIPDLLIAVTALHHGVGVAHADSDFDLIAQVRPLRSWRLDVS
jgi:predicted nucleic acid-binding protein